MAIATIGGGIYEYQLITNEQFHWFHHRNTHSIENVCMKEDKMKILLSIWNTKTACHLFGLIFTVEQILSSQ